MTIILQITAALIGAVADEQQQAELHARAAARLKAMQGLARAEPSTTPE